MHEVDDHDGQPFIVMELLDGEPLSERIAGRPLAIDRVVTIGLEIADALDAAHQAGVVHRDIKPANLFVTSRGHAKVLDFGLAKLASSGAGRADDTDAPTRTGDPQLTSPGAAIGTVAYMSPEQALGGVIDARTDLFALGVVLYEMVTGTRPFTGETPAVVFDRILHQVPAAPVRLNPGIPVELERIIAKAMEKDAALRYQSAADLRADLSRLHRDLSAPQVTAANDRPPSGAGASPRRRHWPAVAAVGLVTAFVVGWQFRGVPALGESDLILLTDISNATGEDVFDGTLKHALALKLDESPFLNVVSASRVRETLRFMNRLPDEVVEAATGLEVCQRLGVKAMLTGNIARLGDAYVMTLATVACESGETIAGDQVQAARREDVLATLGQSVDRLRRRLGESLDSVQTRSVPLERATTGSLEALKAFSQGTQMFGAGDWPAAVPFLRRAIELDADFAVAHARLGVAYANLGEFELGVEHRRRAFVLRDRVSEHERLYITAHDHRAEGNEELAREVYEQWKQIYPRDGIPLNNLGTIYAARGQLERALAEYRLAVDVDPGVEVYHRNVVSVLRMLGRFPEAEAAIARRLERLGDSTSARVMALELALARRDWDAVDRQLAEARGTRYEDDLRGHQAQVAVFTGRLTDARRMLRDDSDGARRRGLTEVAAFQLALWALWEADYGFAAQARQRVADALALSSVPPVRYVTATALATVGRAAEARALLADEIREGIRPEDRLVLAVIEAITAIAEGQPARAVDVLRLHSGQDNLEGPGVAAIYARGRAHLLVGDATGAVTEFNRIVNRPGIDMLSRLHVLAILGTARAHALAGDTDAARRAYTTFLEIWQRADPDRPVLIDARRELSALE